MGLLDALNLKPTRATPPSAGPGAAGSPPAAGHAAPTKAAAPAAQGQARAAPAKSPEIQSLVERFQKVMGRIKALDPSQAPEAAELKKATIAAGNLSTSPKGIVAANAALDKVEAQITDAKAKLAAAQPAQGAAAEGAAAEGAAAEGAPPDGKKAASEARQRLKSLEARGRKAIAANPRNPNAGWLTEVVGNSEGRFVQLEKRGTQREIDEVRKHLDWLEESVVRFEASAAGEPEPGDAAVPDAAKLANEARARLKSLEARGKKAIAADPRNTNAAWLAEVVGNFEGRIVDLEERKTKREADYVRKQLDWLEEGVVRFEEGAKGATSEASGKTAAEESPTNEDAKAPPTNEDAEAPAKPAAKAKAKAKAKADVGKAKGKAKGESEDKAKGEGEEKADADAGKTDAETFDITVGGSKLAGVPRDEAMKALRLEVGKLNAQLESGWAYHVDQMNLPAEVPFQAWLTSGVDSVKSFFKGQDAAKIPDLDIWDPAREMMIEVKKAQRAGDVEAIAALLPKIAAAIPQARAKVGQYQEQMEGSAQTGVDAGRFVEDTSASAIGAIVEKKGGGKAGKIAAQSAAKGVFEGVEQLTEWMIGSRQHADPTAIVKKVGEEAVGAIFKEIVAGPLKGLFKSAFGSYLDKSVSDAALKAMGIGRDAFMTASQKYFAEFVAGQGAGLIKSAIAKLISGKMPSSPEAMVDAIAADLTKGSAKQVIVDGIKVMATAAVTK